MFLKDVTTLLDAEVLNPGGGLGLECAKVFASDLMSDVLAFADSGSLLLTSLANLHTVRTARLADVAAVVFVQGKRPAADVVDQARAMNLPLILTAMPMFDACATISVFMKEGAGGR
jgi:predicted transcriptional regulator